MIMDLSQIVKMKTVLETKHMTWNRVKYFHPEGKSMPNGSQYQRGGFLQECKQNTNSFVLKYLLLMLQDDITNE